VCSRRCTCKNFKKSFKILGNYIDCRSITPKKDCFTEANGFKKTILVSDLCARKCRNCYFKRNKNKAATTEVEATKKVEAKEKVTTAESENDNQLLPI